MLESPSTIVISPTTARGPRHDMKRDVDLMLLLVALLGGRDRATGEIRSLPESAACPPWLVELFLRIKLAQLQPGRARQLVLRRVGGDALDGHDADKKVGDGNEAEPDAGRLRAIHFRLNVGEASAGKQSFHGVVQVVARQRVADL